MECKLTLPTGSTQGNVYFVKSSKKSLVFFLNANITQNLHFCK